jgi:hypothetical protein
MNNELLHENDYVLVHKSKMTEPNGEVSPAW